MGYDWREQGHGHEGTTHAQPGVAPGKTPLTDGLAVQRRADPAAETAAPPPAARVPRISLDMDLFAFGCPPLIGGDGPAEEGKDGGTLIGGNASTMSTGELAAAAWSSHGQFKWWIKWVTDGTSGWISLRVVTPSGRVLTRSSPTEITCTDRRLMIEFAFPIPSLRLPEAGWYRLDMLLDDVELAHLSFEVVAR